MTFWSNLFLKENAKKEATGKTVEPAWAKDEDIWNKAKSIAQKSNTADEPYALTTYLYKKMGGEISSKGKQEDAHDDAVWKKARDQATQLNFPHNTWDLTQHFFRKAGGKIDHPGTNSPSSNGGIWAGWNFFASAREDNAFGKAVPKKTQAPSAPAPETPADVGATVKSPEEQVKEMILENPGMNAATLMNTLKAKGLAISDVKPQIKAEAVSGSSNAAVLRKESSQPFTAKINCRFLEGSARDNGVGPTKFKAVLIQEGLGNLKDCFYYSKEALQDAMASGLFEGKKIYADHPSAVEEQTRPERSVKDILGHFENVRVEEGDQGQAMLTADVVTLPQPAYQWARSLMTHATEFSKKYPDKDFIGLSINASGDAQAQPLQEFLQANQIPDSVVPKLKNAMDQGMSEVKVVNKLTDAISCDLVTEAGAGGRILQMLESQEIKR